MVVIVGNKKVMTTLPQTLTSAHVAIIFLFRITRTSNYTAMGCSRPKEFRTGLRIFLAYVSAEKGL